MLRSIVRHGRSYKTSGVVRQFYPQLSTARRISNMAPTHKALTLSSSHGKYSVSTVPTPAPGLGQLLVKVVATALNPADWKIPEMAVYDEKAYPLTMGFDGAGVVEEVGSDVTDFKKGDRM